MFKWLSLILAAALLAGPLTGCAAEPPARAARKAAPAEPAAEPAAVSGSRLLQLDLHSAALQQTMDITVYLPPGYDAERQYPVLYLLHGYGGNRDSWFNGLSIHRIADRLVDEGRIGPLLIVAPSYGNSFGVNSRAGEGRDPGTVDIGRYEDYLIQEVIPYVDERFGTITEREGRFIGGVSMGGYAALYLGLTHTGLFSKIGGHSAAVWNYTPTDQHAEQRDWLYATPKLREARDPFLLAAAELADRVEIYLDAGDSDPLSDKNKQLYETLAGHGIKARWVPNPGGHSGTYWASQVENYLLFYGGTASKP